MIEKIATARTKAREILELGRKPILAGTFVEFMERADTKPGSVIELYPSSRNEGHSVRNIPIPQRGLGNPSPLWATEFEHTGYSFNTIWKSRTPTNRRLVFVQKHDKVEMDGEGYSDAKYEQARNQWFDYALRMGVVQQITHPSLRFLINGRDGLQGLGHYADSRLLRKVSSTNSAGVAMDERAWSINE
jgi:hypothetical protein